MLEQNLAAQEQLQQSIAETKAKEEHLAELTPDEIVAEIEPLLQDAQTLQQQVDVYKRQGLHARTGAAFV